MGIPVLSLKAAIEFLLKQSHKVKKLEVLFFGGEPMLRFDMIEEIHEYATRRAKEEGKAIHWSMTTNGTLITEKKARRLAEHGVKHLLSLDGAKEDHDRHRKFANGRGSFDCIKNKLPFLKRYQPWLGSRVTFTPATAVNLRKNIEILHELGINQFVIGPAIGPPWNTKDLLAYEEAYLDLCELYLRMKYFKRPFRATLFEDQEPGKGTRAHWGCGAGRGKICVDQYGDIHGCSKLANITGTRNGVLPMGNVLQGFTRIHNRRKLANDSVSPRKKCAKCEFRNVCTGGCAAINAAETGSMYKPNGVNCRMTFIEQRVFRYFRRRYKEVFGEPVDVPAGSQSLISKT